MLLLFCLRSSADKGALIAAFDIDDEKNICNNYAQRRGYRQPVDEVVVVVSSSRCSIYVVLSKDFFELPPNRE